MSGLEKQAKTITVYLGNDGSYWMDRGDWTKLAVLKKDSHCIITVIPLDVAEAAVAEALKPLKQKAKSEWLRYKHIEKTSSTTMWIEAARWCMELLENLFGERFWRNRNEWF